MNFDKVHAVVRVRPERMHRTQQFQESAFLHFRPSRDSGRFSVTVKVNNLRQSHLCLPLHDKRDTLR